MKKPVAPLFQKGAQKGGCFAFRLRSPSLHEPEGPRIRRSCTEARNGSSKAPVFFPARKKQERSTTFSSSGAVPFVVSPSLNLTLHPLRLSARRSHQRFSPPFSRAIHSFFSLSRERERERVTLPQPSRERAVKVRQRGRESERGEKRKSNSDAFLSMEKSIRSAFLLTVALPPVACSISLSLFAASSSCGISPLVAHGACSSAEGEKREAKTRKNRR